MPEHVVAQLNARLHPTHRAEHFEEPLDAALKAAGLGHVSGGGCLQSKLGEVQHSDVEVEVDGPLVDIERLVIATLERLGAPKGSKLHVESEARQVLFGVSEGLAVYLNGTDLADEVYRDCDSNVVYSELERLLDGTGRVLSWWQGPDETALYLYGASFQDMKARTAEFLATYPLCQKCRVEQIA